MVPETSTSRTILALLLEHKAGLTVDQLGERLGISRNAVRQHLTSLQHAGLVGQGERKRGLGRPSQVYTLTPLGIDHFPKQYSMLSELVLGTVREMHGHEGVEALLMKVADRLSSQLRPRVEGDTLAERAVSIGRLMSELGYFAHGETHEGASSITAFNCVFHHLAKEFPEVCRLDIALIKRLAEAEVEHVECMATGGACCRFRLAQTGK